MVGIGLLGSGFIASTYAEALADTRDARLAASYSRNPARARTAAEAAQMLAVVTEAGVWHGYAESSVFSPNLAKAYQMVRAGAIGDLLTMRAREAHSGPHAPHFWNAELAGGGALLDMGCHTVESARHFFGKENRIK